MENIHVTYLNEVQYIQPKMPMRMKTDAPGVLMDLIVESKLSVRSDEFKLINELMSILKLAEPELIF